MRPALLVVASLLAGCREGIELEILADSTTIRVEVFLAAHAPLGDVTELAPENAERIEGIAFPRNLTPDGAIEPPVHRPRSGADGRARLELQADDRPHGDPGADRRRATTRTARSSARRCSTTSASPTRRSG